jgi:hypothetical protein
MTLVVMVSLLMLLVITAFLAGATFIITWRAFLDMANADDWVRCIDGVAFVGGNNTLTRCDVTVSLLHANIDLNLVFFLFTFNNLKCNLLLFEVNFWCSNVNVSLTTTHLEALQLQINLDVIGMMMAITLFNSKMKILLLDCKFLVNSLRVVGHTMIG